MERVIKHKFNSCTLYSDIQESEFKMAPAAKMMDLTLQDALDITSGDDSALRNTDGWKSMPAPIIGSRGVSVIVPCYEEAENIEEFTMRLFKACRHADLDCELILVDDYSGKETEETKKIVQNLEKEYGFDVKLFVRTPEEGKGLSTAVVYGLKKARNETLVVMDGDLQHEPESVPHVATPIFEQVADFSVGSRAAAGSRIEDWALSRQVLSWFATFIALPLTSVSDPLSGFFALSKTTFLRGLNQLNPVGFKIALELLVKCKCKRVQEVPIKFVARKRGESKLSLKESLLYLQQLSHLYMFYIAEIAKADNQAKIASNSLLVEKKSEPARNVALSINHETDTFNCRMMKRPSIPQGRRRPPRKVIQFF